MKQTLNKCEKCGKSFSPHYTTKGKQRFCSQKCRYTSWVNNNREHLNATVRKYRARRYLKEGQWRDESPKARVLKAWMVELKSKPCRDCGGTFEVCCMDFDHRKGTVKKYNVGSMFAHHYSQKLIESELAKCDLVCANCHRIRTRNRRTGSAKQNNARICGVSED